MNYLSYTSMSPCEIQGDIVLPKHHNFRFGIHKDINGKEWHINGYTNGTVLATPIHNLHPYFYSTTTNLYGNFSQTWKPYNIVIQQQPAKGE